MNDTTSPQAVDAAATPAASSPSAPIGASTGGLRDAVVTALIACTVAACALLAYDRLIRDPRTPRLGTVDVGAIFAANQAVAIKKLLAGAANLPADALGAQAGQAMARQLQDFAQQRCHCVLIASPAVFGTTAVVPDYTAEIKAAYGLTVDPAEFQMPAPPQRSAPGSATTVIPSQSGVGR